MIAFPFQKQVDTFLECGMCQLPAPYQCEECQQCWKEETQHVAMAPAPKIFIGSGEDGHLFNMEC